MDTLWTLQVQITRLAGSVTSLLMIYRLLEEADHHVGVYERRVVSDEGLGDVRHDAGVVPGKAFGLVHLHTEPGPGPFRGEPLWYQQVPVITGPFEAQRGFGSRDLI